MPIRKGERKMNRTSILILASLFLLDGLLTESRAQVRPGLLQEIGQHNLQLQALRQHAEAEKASARAGIFNHQPEVEVGYLWGDPSSIGNRIDLNVTQSFDFPTAYVFRRQVCEKQRISAGLEYDIRRQQLMEEAGCLCIRLIACNRMKTALEKRLQHAEKLDTAYGEMFRKGECGILDANKAGLNLLNARKAFEENEIERLQLLRELQAMNAGQSLLLDDTDYLPVQLPGNFESWYASLASGNPVLKNIENLQALQEQRLKLQKALCLPGFSVGYQSEAERESAYRGIGVGLSIPLWGSARQLKAAKAEAEAQAALGKDGEQQFYRQLQSLYEKAVSLRQLSEHYCSAMQRFDSGPLLQLALEKGEISLVEYLMELSLYYDSFTQCVETEEAYMLAAFRLLQWE